MENKDFFDNLEEKEIIKCPNCGKELKDYDIEKGCPYCEKEFEFDYSAILKRNQIKKENNTISTTLKVVAWIIFVIGLILGFVLGVDEYEELYLPLMLEIWFMYGIAFLGTYSLAEIIQILHDIRLKVWK